MHVASEQALRTFDTLAARQARRRAKAKAKARRAARRAKAVMAAKAAILVAAFTLPFWPR